MAELLEFRTIWNVAMPGDSLVWETWIYGLNKQGFYLSTFIIKFNFTKRQTLLQWILTGEAVNVWENWSKLMINGHWNNIIKNPIALFTSKWLVHLGNKQLWAGKQSDTSRSNLFDNLRKSNWNYDTFLFSFFLIRTVTLAEFLGLNRSEYLFHNSTPEKHQQSETFEKNKKMFFSPTSKNYNWAEHIAELDSFFVLWGEEQKNAKSRRWMSLLTFGLRVQ